MTRETWIAIFSLLIAVTIMAAYRYLRRYRRGQHQFNGGPIFHIIHLRYRDGGQRSFYLYEAIR